MFHKYSRLLNAHILEFKLNCIALRIIEILYIYNRQFGRMRYKIKILRNKLKYYERIYGNTL